VVKKGKIMKTTTMLIKGIDPKLKTKFKTHCAAKGISMQTMIIKMIAKKVK